MGFSEPKPNTRRAYRVKSGRQIPLGESSYGRKGIFSPLLALRRSEKGFYQWVSLARPLKRLLERIFLPFDVRIRFLKPCSLLR